MYGLMMLIALVNIATCRTNPHLHRRVVSKEHNYNWHESYVLNNKSNKIVKSSRSNIRVLADGSAEVVTDLVVPSGVDGVATAYNDESIGVYINFTDGNPDVNGSLWTPIIRGNYLCGGGKSKMNYTFSSDLSYIQEKEVDPIGVICVIGIAIAIFVVATATWPMFLSMNASIMKLFGNSVLEAKMQITQTDVLLENINGSKLAEDNEMYEHASGIVRNYNKTKNSFLNRFKFAWLIIGACFIALFAIVLAHIFLVHLGLPCFFKIVKANKCYYIDQSGLLKANDESAGNFTRSPLGAKSISVGKYVGDGKFLCRRGRCVKATGNKYNMKILGLGDSIGNIRINSSKRVQAVNEDFKHVEITASDEANATGTPNIEEDDGSMLFTTPCGTTWRNVMDGVRWVMMSPNVDVCNSEESTIITDIKQFRRTRCTGGKWTYKDGDWDRPTPQRAGATFNLGLEVSDNTFSLFSCGFLSLGAMHAGGRVWFETIHRDDWVYCYIQKTGKVGFQRETVSGKVNSIVPEYEIESYTDVREQRPNGWYEDGNYVYAIPDDFDNGEKYTLSSGEYSSIEYAKEKIDKMYVWENGNYRNKYELKKWDTAVDDFTCTVTFRLKNAEKFEEFQEPCADIKAVTYKDGRIQLKTTQKRTCKVQVRFANSDKFITTYSLNNVSPVTIPQGATDWRCKTTPYTQDGVTKHDTGVGCSVDENTPFDSFKARDYDGTFQCTIEYSEAPEPGITTLNDVANKLSSAVKNILAGVGSVLDIIKIVGIIIGVIILIVVLGSIIFCLLHPKEAVEMTHVVADTATSIVSQAAAGGSGVPT